MGQLQTQWDQPAAPPQPPRRLIVGGALLIGGAAIIGVASLAFFAFSLWQFASNGMIARKVVPATFTMQIDEPGKYLIYYEHQSVIDGRSFQTSRQTPALNFQLADATGQPISLDPPRMQHTYETPSRQGSSWFEFEAPAAGTYELEVTGTGNEQYVIAVGQPTLGTFLVGMATLICAGALAMVMLVVGSVLLVVGFVKRSART